jgi:GDPmannose 4,6-dehydratase
MKRALITGATGQDGAYLSRMLLEKGYEVHGTHGPAAHEDLGRLRELGIDRDVRLTAVDLGDAATLRETVETVAPHEVYNLAAQSFVAASFEKPVVTAEVNAMGTLRLLEAVRSLGSDVRYYQASSGDMFGTVETIPQSESTPFRPRSPYAVAKLFAHWMTVTYREAHGMFACSGILFNHESPLRGIEFVTRKISSGIANLKLSGQGRLRLGNLDARRDWGYAADYVEAMWLMLQQDEAADYVIATGETHSVREFVDAACRAAEIDLEWQGSGLDERGINRRTSDVIVEISEEFFRPSEVNQLVGDASKARSGLGWQPQTRFDDLVALMVEADLRRLTRVS